MKGKKEQSMMCYLSIFKEITLFKDTIENNQEKCEQLLDKLSKEFAEDKVKITT